jgi:hypothetical protein
MLIITLHSIVKYDIILVIEANGFRCFVVFLQLVAADCVRIKLILTCDSSVSSHVDACVLSGVKCYGFDSCFLYYCCILSHILCCSSKLNVEIRVMYKELT